MKQETIDALGELEELYQEMQGLKDDIQWKSLKIYNEADDDDMEKVSEMMYEIEDKYG